MTKCKEPSTLMATVIFVSLESFGVQVRPAQAQAALATDINYLSYGNAWGEPNSTPTSDSRFAKDGIEPSMLWSATDLPRLQQQREPLNHPRLDVAEQRGKQMALNIHTRTSPKQAYQEWAKHPGQR